MKTEKNKSNYSVVENSYEMEMLIKGTLFKKYTEKKFSEIANKYKLNKNKIEILYYLALNEKYNTMAEICKRLCANKGQVSRDLFSLGTHGYVTSIHDENDRRCIHYSLTEQAVSIIKDIFDIRKQSEKEIVDNISEEELNMFMNISVKMVRNIEKALEE